MKQFLLIAAGLVVMLAAAGSQKQVFDKISVREFELVDDRGKQRVSIKVEPDGEVVLRLRDKKENIRVKIGAGEDGSGFVFLDANTNPGLHGLAKKEGSSLTVMDKDGKKRTF